MNIYAKRGDKVKFTGNGGHESENAEARSMLEIGGSYTVEHVAVYNWHSEVLLKEVKGPFNSVMFDDLENQ